jgi:3-methyl-2-oxobutanoate hydroxymethyltransferase
MSEKRVTEPSLREMKKQGEKIAMLTAYECSMAELIDDSGVDVILVGDTLAMVFAGYENTLPVTMDAMIYHTEIVARSAKRAMVIGDMPFMSYQVNAERALDNAGRFIKEARAQGVKLEGGRAMVPTIRRIVRSGIPVMGHIGLTPQSVYKFGGFKLQGRTPADAQALLDSAKALEDNGIFALVVECIPADVAARISETLEVPVIGIGAGPHCDGQVLVTPDMLGIFDKFRPKFVKRYATVADEMRKAFRTYVKDVKEGVFPDDEHTYK